eukprot:GHVL01037842.1.p1 GENE.GHVL01037842.1~~GHVL01037842.1.p1  ORF type:complete len:114 (+),score=6.02 GHVL01037842.1:126-467(+)
MVLVSADPRGFETALSLCEDLINSVIDEFQLYCRNRDRPLPSEFGFRRHEYVLKPDGATTLLNTVAKLRFGSERGGGYRGGSYERSRAYHRPPSSRGGQYDREDRNSRRERNQ